MSYNAKRLYGRLDRQQVFVLGELHIRPDGTGYVEFSTSNDARVEITRSLGIAERDAAGGIDDSHEMFRCGQCAHCGLCDKELREETCEFFVHIPADEEQLLTCKNCPHVKFEHDWSAERCPKMNEDVYACTLACGYHPEHPEHAWYADEEWEGGKA